MKARFIYKYTSVDWVKMLLKVQKKQGGFISVEWSSLNKCYITHALDHTLYLDESWLDFDCCYKGLKRKKVKL